MAITVNTDILSSYRSDAGQADGNEVIYNLNCNRSTTIEVVFTAGGSGTLKSSVSPIIPADFTNFTPDSAGAITQSTMWNLAAGIQWIGFDLTSGTTTVNVRQNS